MAAHYSPIKSAPYFSYWNRCRVPVKYSEPDMDSFKAIDLSLPPHFVAALGRPTVLVGFACVFLFSQLLVWTAKYSRKKSKGLADIPGPSGWPIIGIGLDLPARPRKLLNSWANQFGDTFKVRVGWYNWVFFNHPDAVKEVFDRQVIQPPTSESLAVRMLIQYRRLSRPVNHRSPSPKNTVFGAMVCCR